MPAEGEEMRASDTAVLEPVVRRSAEIVSLLRTKTPRVHCITNTVAQNFTANALLAAGCVPSMTLSADEIAGFVASAEGLLVNLGTLDAERRQAADTAVASATARGMPWVLDPVFVDRSPGRAAFARALLACKPAVVRLNHAEFGALAETPPNEKSVAAFARTHNCVVALSGKADLVSDGERNITIENGHALMARVTAMGCAGSALVAAFCAIEADTFTASAAALLMLGIAGEQAVERAAGPGNFAAAILDALYSLEPQTIVARAKCK
jgi:hydroxyethylthiazole kinase